MATNPLDNNAQINNPKNMVQAEVSLGGEQPKDVTVKEVIIGESLLNPSAHVAVTLQSAMYFAEKNWDALRGQALGLYVYDRDKSREMNVNMTTYRCDNRHFSTLNTRSEEHTSELQSH